MYIAVHVFLFVTKKLFCYVTWSLETVLSTFVSFPCVLFFGFNWSEP